MKTFNNFFRKIKIWSKNFNKKVNKKDHFL